MPTNLEKEINKNFENFSKSWKKELNDGILGLEKKKKNLQESYRRLTSLQAWRTTIIEQSVSSEVLGFFLEAQNDSLISHVQASCGSWRVSLKSLRSLIENILYTLYYMDHPIELRLWSEGRHKLGFKELVSYLERHPDYQDIRPNLNGIEIIKSEYAVLSRVVHASSRGFRMSEDGNVINLWDTDQKKVSKWATREKNTLLGVNLFLITMFKKKLQGTKCAALRQTLAFVIPKNKDNQIKKQLSITIKRS